MVRDTFRNPRMTSVWTLPGQDATPLGGRDSGLKGQGERPTRVESGILGKAMFQVKIGKPIQATLISHLVDADRRRP